MITLNVNTREEILVHVLRVNDLLEERVQILQSQLAEANAKVTQLESLATATPRLLKVGDTTTFLEN